MEGFKGIMKNKKNKIYNKAEIKAILIEQIMDSKNKAEIIKSLSDGICFVTHNFEDFNPQIKEIKEIKSIKLNGGKDGREGSGN